MFQAKLSSSPPSIKTYLYYPNKTWIQCANMNIELMHDDAMAGRDYDEDDND